MTDYGAVARFLAAQRTVDCVELNRIEQPGYEHVRTGIVIVRGDENLLWNDACEHLALGFGVRELYTHLVSDESFRTKRNQILDWKATSATGHTRFTVRDEPRQVSWRMIQPNENGVVLSLREQLLSVAGTVAYFDRRTGASKRFNQFANNFSLRSTSTYTSLDTLANAVREHPPALIVSAVPAYSAPVSANIPVVTLDPSVAQESDGRVSSYYGTGVARRILANVHAQTAAQSAR